MESMPRGSAAIPDDSADEIEMETETETEVEVVSLRRFHQLTSVAWRRHRRALKGRRFNVQRKRQRGPGSKVLCRTLAFRGRRLTISGEAAIGILMPLPP